MAVTFIDCLNLPTLQNAQILAGQSGLKQPISTAVSLAYSHITAGTIDPLPEQALVLTSFASIDDADTQCSMIQRLHSAGAVGLVLHYVGYYIKSLDPRPIALADKLGFPIFLLLPGTSCRHCSDAAEEIQDLIVQEQKKDERFAPSLLGQISRMRERERTAAGILRLLSAQLQSSLLMLDRDGRECGIAPWPETVPEELTDRFRSCADHTSQFPMQFTLCGQHYEVRRYLFSAAAVQNLRLFIMEEAGTHSPFREDQIGQAIEILQISYNIWRQNLQKTESDDMVRLLLSGQDHDIRRVARDLRIDLSSFRIMWLLLPHPLKRVSHLPPSTLQKINLQLKDYLREKQKTVISDALDDGIITFMDAADHFSADEALVWDFTQLLRDAYPELMLVTWGGLSSAAEVRTAYELTEQYCAMACKVFPRKDVLTCWEIAFTCSCHTLFHSSSPFRDIILSVLDPLMDQKDTPDILDTLGTYLLDTNKSTIETATLLHIHESTVKYRINKVSCRLGYDCTHMPENYSLSLALAFQRLLTPRVVQESLGMAVPRPFSWLPEGPF